MKTVIGMFDDLAQAKNAALDLENAGIPHGDISFVASNASGQYAANNANTPYAPVDGHAVGHDATIGAEIGGVAGLILSLTGVMIPGLGWIAGAGWLMAIILGAATGAVIGGLVGALTHVGVPAEDAGYYTEGVRRGGTLVAVRAQDSVAQRVADILGNDGAVDIDQRAAEYRAEGYAPISDTGYVPPATITSETTTLETETIAYPPVTDTTLPASQPEGAINAPVTGAAAEPTNLPADRLRVPVYPHSAPTQGTIPATNEGRITRSPGGYAPTATVAPVTTTATDIPPAPFILQDTPVVARQHIPRDTNEDINAGQPINEGQATTNPVTTEPTVTAPDR